MLSVSVDIRWKPIPNTQLVKTFQCKTVREAEKYIVLDEKVVVIYALTNGVRLREEN